MRRPATIALLSLVAALPMGCSGPDAYPNRPIVLICPWSAGGGTDRVARQVAVLLEQELGTPVNVINATGGSGVTGHTRGALARPDGYTLTIITVELNMLRWRGLSSISHRDFEPLIQLNRDDAALFVRGDAPWETLADLRRAIADRPPTLKASGTAQGGIWHVSLAGWLDAIGLGTDAVTWISVNGAAPSLQELLSGGVQMVCCSLPEARTLLDAGEVRCLGVMSDRRNEAFPAVPTFREQGDAWSFGGWRGLAVPKGVPRDRVDRLIAALDRVVTGEPYRRFMESNGFTSAVLRPDAFVAALADDDRRFRDLLTRPAFAAVRAGRYGPYAFPSLLGGALVVALLWILVGLWRHRGERPGLSAAGVGRIAIVSAWIVALVWLMEPVGFVLAGSTLLLLLLLVMRVRPPLAVGLAVTVVPLVYQVFAVALRVPLPWGWLGW